MSTIERLASTNHERISAFLNENPLYARTLEAVLDVDWRLIVALLQQGVPNESELWIGQMLQTLHGYYKSSAFLVINKNLDEGFAVLRMAAELARDIRCIYSNNHLVTVWLKKGSSPDAEKTYRKRFSFNVATTEGKLGYEAYKLTCKLGVHGHITTMSHSELQGGKETEFVELGVSDETVVEMLKLWLKSFVCIHRLAFDVGMLTDISEHEALRQHYATCLLAADTLVKHK